MERVPLSYRETDTSVTDSYPNSCKRPAEERTDCEIFLHPKRKRTGKRGSGDTPLQADGLPDLPPGVEGSGKKRKRMHRYAGYILNMDFAVSQCAYICRL